MEQPATSKPKSYEEIKNSLIPLLDLPEGEYLTSIGGFVQKRLTELESSPRTVQMLDGLHGNYQGFLHSDVEVNPAVFGAGFKIDDPAIYRDLFTRLRYFQDVFKATAVGDDKDYEKAVFHAIQYALQDYFGNVVPSDAGMKRREQMVWRGAVHAVGEEDQAYEPASIAEFKDIALCAERAAVANNMLQLLGFEPVMVSGKLEREDDTEPELHSFLVIRNCEGREMIYDPSNPIIVLNQEDKAAQMGPALYGTEDFLSSKGASISVSKLRYKLDELGKPVLVRQKPYTYMNSVFGNELHPR